MAEYDVVVIGAGHNGETVAAYLARAGLNVILLERRLEIGGGLATEEPACPGFIFNLHSIYHMMVDFAPPYGDLELEKFGVRYVRPPVQVSMPLRDGRCLTLYTDVERTYKSIARFSEKDADSYREMYIKFKRFTDEIIAPATYYPPLPPVDQASLLGQSDFGLEFLELSERSPLEVIDELFSDEHVKGLMLYLTCLWGLEYNAKGLGYLIPLYINRATYYNLCVGGSHKVSSALGRVITRNGGMIMDNAEVTKISIKDGEAKGVELADGKTIMAKKAVVSSLNPRQTFLNLIGEELLDKDFANEVDGWEWENLSLFTGHFALDKAPKYKASEYDSAIDEALICVLGFDTEDELISHWRNVMEGEPIGNATCPTLFDKTQAPDGKHTGLFENPFVPYNLENGGPQAWDRIRYEYLDRCLSEWQRYAPNMRKENVLCRYPYTPLDIERKLVSMTRGSIKHGAYTPMQMGYFRPSRHCSQYRTPIRKLYVCGASCYPGGLITFGPGYNAVNTIAEGLGIQKWWATPDYILEAKQKGYLQ